MSQDTAAIARPAGISHVRLTVTDIARSKAFYTQALGSEPAADFSDQINNTNVRNDPDRLFGGCVFALGAQAFGLRPAAPSGDSFISTRVGLDHISLQLNSIADLREAAHRLTEAGIQHGDVKELSGYGLAILSFQDPDDINLEFSAPL
jgi:catechol 2,3-dioxygenase-like lactoylglutathione lyase family enzyme